jgi:FlaA1/EpsC-like NDP-sugar epimerase
MTIPEAVGLVLQAGAIGRGGEIFVLDMGEPIKIVDLAKQMIEIAGYEVGKDIQIEYTGLRPGEKMYEELAHKNEELSKTSHPKISCLVSSSSDLNWIELQFSALGDLVKEQDNAAIKKSVRNIVPEYNSYS